MSEIINKIIIEVGGQEYVAEQLQSDWNQTDTEQKDYIENKPTLPDVSSKEEKMAISVSSTAPASITAEANTYYRIDAAVGTMDVTLPAITGATTVSTIVFGFTTDSTPAVTFSSAAQGAGSPYAPTLESSKNYEVSCLWNGSSWNIACAEINKV